MYSSSWEPTFILLTTVEAVLMLLLFKTLFVLDIDENSGCIKLGLIYVFSC